ncbi:rhodanese-like domain-containing protein [Neobacillus sp. PS3-40]|uniref:rhodanese-like domain-containing protein n=1 Tax=Neobacillus sp. PS3-40 TaxID=3070679 RepID=UPI0027E0FDEF|nr:rhodanese-like domain-containing protein [Neobacillus sp. PS3-40]WML43197.1 rhodanese-like domain-containing protein [Neobacillus sp. PS3-40]
MTKKVTLITVGIAILFIGFVIIYMNIAMAKNETMNGMAGMSENRDVKGKDQEVHKIDQSYLLKEIKSTDVMIVDLREPNLYKKSHIPNSINIPFEEFQSKFQELDVNKTIILVCHMGPMGDASGQLLLQQGFKHVANLSGGMANWTGPLVK